MLCYAMLCFAASIFPKQTPLFFPFALLILHHHFVGSNLQVGYFSRSSFFFSYTYGYSAWIIDNDGIYKKASQSHGHWNNLFQLPTPLHYPYFNTKMWPFCLSFCPLYPNQYVHRHWVIHYTRALAWYWYIHINPSFLSFIWIEITNKRKVTQNWQCSSDWERQDTKKKDGNIQDYTNDKSMKMQKNQSAYIIRFKHLKKKGTNLFLGNRHMHAL